MFGAHQSQLFAKAISSAVSPLPQTLVATPPKATKTSNARDRFVIVPAIASAVRFVLFGSYEIVAPHAMATFATSFPFCAAQNNGVSPLPRGSESQKSAPDGSTFITSIEPIKQACKTGTLFDLDDFNGLAPRLNNISTHFGLFAVAAPASGVTPKEESNSTSAPATFTSASNVFASSLAMAYKMAVRPS